MESTKQLKDVIKVYNEILWKDIIVVSLKFRWIVANEGLLTIRSGNGYFVIIYDIQQVARAPCKFLR